MRGLNRPGRYSARQIGGLRTRLAEAVPLISGRPRQRATGREVNRDQQVSLGAVPREGAAAWGSDPNSALEKFEVDVTVAIVDEPLGREEDLRVPGAGPGVADRVDVAQIVLGRDGAGGRPDRGECIAVLRPPCDGGPVARAAGSRLA